MNTANKKAALFKRGFHFYRHTERSEVSLRQSLEILRAAPSE
jgi:hypothetical protein